MEKASIEANKSWYEIEMEKAWQSFYDGHLEQSSSICEILIKKYPEKCGCGYLLAHIYREQNLYQKSVDQFLSALNKDNNEDQAGYIYYWLGEIYSLNDFLGEDNNYIYDLKKSEEYYQLSKKSKRFPPELLLHYQRKVKGQDKIDLCEEGINRFPHIHDFYILLATEYGHKELYKLQFNLYNRALKEGLSYPSLFYNLGYYYYCKKDYPTALSYFEKSIKVNEDYLRSNFVLYYWLAKSYEKSNDSKQAEIFFIKAYQTETRNSDCLLGFFALLNHFLTQKKTTEIRELLQDFDLNEEVLDIYGVVFGPFWLSKYPDEIHFDEFSGLYQRLIKLKFERENELFKGKVWVIRCFIALILLKYDDQYQAIKNARKYLNNYYSEFIDKMHGDALGNLILYKTSTIDEVQKTYESLLSDFKEVYGLHKNILYSIDTLTKILFKQKDFDKIITILNFYTQQEISGLDLLFELAYSYAEKEDNHNAKKYYQLYLIEERESSAALNNLGNLYKQETRYIEAIELYKRGLEIDPNDEILQRNLKNTLQKVAEIEKKAAQEKALKNEYIASINFLKSENDYVLDKLRMFIEQIKKEKDFGNWSIPIAKNKFQKYLGVDKQRAESLTSQWLTKGYIRNTGERSEFNVIIYSINPFIEDEINRINKYVIPPHWIDNFINISVSTLEENGFFSMMDRIVKVNKKFRPLLERDFNELTYNYLMGHEKATIVLSGYSAR